MKKNKVGCVSHKTFIQIFLGDLKPDKKAKIVDHIFSCPECRMKFETLNSLTRKFREKEKELPAEALTAADARELRKATRLKLREMKKSLKQPARFYLARRPVLILAVSSAVVIVCLSVLVYLKSPLGQKTFRAPEGKKLALIEPRGRIKSVPTILNWRPIERADGYIIKIVDEDLKTIFKGDAEKPPYILNEGIWEKFAREKKYIWAIHAYDDNNNIIAQAKAYFIIENRAP
jgi:hypothetical protein